MTPKAILETLLEKGTVWSGIFISAGFLLNAILTKYESTLGLTHEQFDDFKSNLFYFWCTLALTAIVSNQVRKKKLDLKIAAATVLGDPSNPSNYSPVPEVQTEVDKIVRKSHAEGVPLYKGKL